MYRIVHIGCSTPKIDWMGELLATHIASEKDQSAHVLKTFITHEYIFSNVNMCMLYIFFYP